MDIQWEEPPAEVVLRSRASGAKYIDFAIELRRHEGKWALLPLEQPYANLASAQSAAQNIRRGVTKAFAPKGSFDAVAGEDGAKIWVKFLGEPKGKEPAGDDDERPELTVEDETGRTFAQTVRAWARENDIPVPERGRLPEAMITRYCHATDTPRPSYLQPR